MEMQTLQQGIHRNKDEDQVVIGDEVEEVGDAEYGQEFLEEV